MKLYCDFIKMFKKCQASLCIVMLMLMLKLKQQTLETEFNQLECVPEVCASKWMTAIFPLPPEGDVDLRNILSVGVGGGGWMLSSALRVDSSVSSIQSHSSVSDMGANSSNVSSLFLLTCVERCRIANHALFNPAHNGHVGLHYRRYCGAQSITFRN